MPRTHVWIEIENDPIGMTHIELRLSKEDAEELINAMNKAMIRHDLAGDDGEE